MLVEIKQVTGKDDKTPGKEALLNNANLKDALKGLYPDEEFEVKVITRNDSQMKESLTGVAKALEELDNLVSSLVRSLL